VSEKSGEAQDALVSYMHQSASEPIPPSVPPDDSLPALEQMRLAYLLPGIYALDGRGNGVRIYAQRLASSLQDRGVQVSFLRPDEPFEPDRYDIVHHFLGGYYHFRIERRKLPNAVVFTPMIDTTQPLLLYRMAVEMGRWIPRIHTIPAELSRQAREADVVLCPSERARERAIRALGVRPERIHLVKVGPRPLPLSNRSAEEVLRELGIVRPYLFHLSYYSDSRKNVLRLVQAAVRCKKQIVICGTFEENEIVRELRRMAADPGVDLVLCPPVEDGTLRTLYANCAAFCLPSLHEEIGQAALEAGSTGVPVVITSIGGTRDYFGEHAHFVDPNSVESIARAIQRACSQGDGKKLQTHIEEKLGDEALIDGLARAYRIAIASRMAR